MAAAVDAERTLGTAADYGAAWERLVQWRAKLARSRKRKAARRLLKYVSTRQEMIRYPTFRTKGWQIGADERRFCCHGMV